MKTSDWIWAAVFWGVPIGSFCAVMFLGWLAGRDTEGVVVKKQPRWLAWGACGGIFGSGVVFTSWLTDTPSSQSPLESGAGGFIWGIILAAAWAWYRNVAEVSEEKASTSSDTGGA